MEKPESTMENETYKILRDFDIYTDYLIQAGRQELHIVLKKRSCQVGDFAVLANHRVKI